MYSWKTPILVPFCLPQIPYRLATAQTQVAAEREAGSHPLQQFWVIKIGSIFLSNALQFMKCNALWKVPRLCPIFILVKRTQMKMSMEYWWKDIDKGNRNTRRKIYPSATVQRLKTKIYLLYVHMCYSFIPWRVIPCSIYEFKVDNFTITFIWQDGLCSTYIPHIRMVILTQTSERRTKVFQI